MSQHAEPESPRKPDRAFRGSSVLAVVVGVAVLASGLISKLPLLPVTAAALLVGLLTFGVNLIVLRRRNGPEGIR